MRCLPRILFTLPICTLLAARIAGAAPCESLATMPLSGGAITVAQTVQAGQFSPPGAAGGRGGRGGGGPYGSLPAFCRVAATLKPSSDSEINIEVWLPAAGWNGKLLSVGNGGWAGSITYADMASAIASGYASASTDTGHSGGAATFVVGHPEKVTDFSFRAIHEMTVAAKSIITANYGAAARSSYFKGCSTGGRQALTEAQRFPLDYDGIIAGASAINASRLHGTQVWFSAQSHRDDASALPANKYAALHDAVVRACDALDGAQDRVIENPRQCKFDPAVLLCKAADATDCLTAPQVETVRRIYAGPGIFPGFELGSEGGWNGTLATPVGIASDMYRYLVFDKPDWDYKTLDIERDVALFDKAIGPTMNSSDTNLKPFFDHGGKLLMYHGWADPGIPPGNSVRYFTDVVERMGGPAAASNSIRLFMLPGVGHCGGGDGPSTFDSTAALDQWAQQGKAPDSILASHATNGAVDRTRPLCPYPQVAKYKGTGSIDEAANFVCAAP